MNEPAGKGKTRPTRRGFLKGTIALSGLLGFPAGAYAWRSNRLCVVYERASLWNLPTPLRIGIVTDLHAPYYTFETAELIDAINEAGCDFLCILGDMADTPHREALIGEICRGMRARGGKFAILGNWEYWGGLDRDRLAEAYGAAGVELLVNGRRTCKIAGRSIRIVGLDDLLGGRPDYALLEEKPGTPTIVLSHCPATAHEIARRRGSATLILSGHTHGGQITPFGVVLRLPPGSAGFVRGWYPLGTSRLYVSPGLGNSILPFRLGQPPTLAILDIS